MSSKADSGTEPPDPFAAVRENEASVETLTGRTDRIGAAARVILALARGDRPAAADLETLGIPIGPTFDETGGPD